MFWFNWIINTGTGGLTGYMTYVKKKTNKDIIKNLLQCSE